MYILRKYQELSVQKMLAETTGKHALVLPPGSGKTVIMANYIKSLKDKAVLVVVHRDELVAQTVEKLSSYGVASGIEKGTSKTNPVVLRDMADAINRKKLKYEGRVKDREEILMLIPEEREKKTKELEAIIEHNAKNKKKYQDYMTGLLEKYPRKSSEFRLKREELKTKYKKAKRSADKLLRTLNETLERKEWDAKHSIKFSEARLKRLNSFNPEAPSIVVASVQSMHEGRLKLWPEDVFDVIIFDEAHHLRAPTWKAIGEYYDAPIQFGFSATWKPKDDGFKTMVNIDIMTMIEEGWLVKPSYYKIDAREKKIEPDSLEHDRLLLKIIKENKNDKIIVFCASVGQALRLKSEIPWSFALTADTPTKERRSAVRRFKEGALMVLLNYQIVYEGFDDPGATMILSKMTPDDNVYLQASGRGFRPNKWKNSVKIYDVIMKDNQSTLPTIFGLHKDWEFEGDPFEDAKKAIAFAKENDLNLKLYPNWGFLKMKRTPESFNKPKTPRKDSTPYKETLGGAFSIIGYRKKYAIGVGYGGSNFYSPQESLNYGLHERLKKELNYSPVKNIDPASVKENRKVVDQETEKKMRSGAYIREYWRHDKFLKQLRSYAVHKPLTEKQMDVAIQIGEQIDAALAKNL